MAKGNIVQLNPGWWEKERQPATGPLKVTRRSKLADRYFSPREWAERLRCSADVFYDAVKSGELECVRPGGHLIRISEEAMQSYLAQKGQP